MLVSSSCAWITSAETATGETTSLLSKTAPTVSLPVFESSYFTGRVSPAFQPLDRATSSATPICPFVSVSSEPETTVRWMTSGKSAGVTPVTCCQLPSIVINPGSSRDTALTPSTSRRAATVEASMPAPSSETM